MPSLTRKSKQVLVATIVTPDTCKAVMQDTAIKVAINHLPHIGSEKAILFGKTLVIDLLKRLETCPVKYLDSISDEI